MTFKEIRFTGGRFEENSGLLDLSVLPELEVYHNLLSEIAKDVWRQSHSNRTNLPSGFGEEFRLGISEISEGSCRLLLERSSGSVNSKTLMQMKVDDAFDKSAEIIDQTLLAIQNEELFPEGVTYRTLAMFEDWAKKLRHDESIVLIRSDGSEAYFNHSIREILSLRTMQLQIFRDNIYVTGEVRKIELREQTGGSFELKLDTGDNIRGSFTDEQESDITNALHNHYSVRLRIRGEGEFEPSGDLRSIVRIDHYEIIPSEGIAFDSDAPSLTDMFDDLREGIPEDAWDDVPTDLSKNLDHYLYGRPKEYE